MKRQVLNRQQVLNDNLALAAERGDIKDAREHLLHGAELGYFDFKGYGIMDNAAAYGHISFIEFLVRLGVNDPEKIGRALITTTHADVVRVLAQYNPDCAVENHYGWTAYEVMLLNRNYDLIDTYKQCGLPVPPLKDKMRRYINRNYDLKTWSIATGIGVPDAYYHQLQSSQHDKRCCRRLYKRIIKELTVNAA